MGVLFLTALALASRSSKPPVRVGSRWLSPLRRSGALPQATRREAASAWADGDVAGPSAERRRGEEAPGAAEGLGAGPVAERARERAPLEGDSRVVTLEKSTDVGAPQLKLNKDIGIEDMLCVRPAPEAAARRARSGGVPRSLARSFARSTRPLFRRELREIQGQGPRKVCILGTRHCSYLHQQIIELLSYALVLSGNHVYTSGASGTNARPPGVRGARRGPHPSPSPSAALRDLVSSRRRRRSAARCAPTRRTC